MSGTTIKCQITDAICNRLKSITTANGYCTDVKKVYFDKIPMGLTMQAHQLPAILYINVSTRSTTELGGCRETICSVQLQLWHCDGTSDCTMNEFENDIMAAIYANSPTLATNSAYRSLHPSLVSIDHDSTEFDLYMLDANRVSCVNMLIKYRSPLFRL